MLCHAIFFHYQAIFVLESQGISSVRSRTSRPTGKVSLSVGACSPSLARSWAGRDLKGKMYRMPIMISGHRWNHVQGGVYLASSN